VQKRNDTNRRCSSAGMRLPFRDSDGELVRRERRKLPERRLEAGLEMEWMEMVCAAGSLSGHAADQKCSLLKHQERSLSHVKKYKSIYRAFVM